MKFIGDPRLQAFTDFNKWKVCRQKIFTGYMTKIMSSAIYIDYRQGSWRTSAEANAFAKTLTAPLQHGGIMLPSEINAVADKGKLKAIMTGITPDNCIMIYTGVKLPILMPLREAVTCYKYADGSDINPKEIKPAKECSNCFDWVSIRHNPTTDDANNNLRSIYFDESYKGALQDDLGNVSIIQNGTFLVAKKTPKGYSIKAYTKYEFAYLFDVRGWSDVIDTETMKRVDSIEMTKPDFKAFEDTTKMSDSEIKAIFNKILDDCVKTSHSELPFEYKPTEKGFVTKASVCKEYALNIDKELSAKNGEETVKSRTYGIRSEIEIGDVINIKIINIDRFGNALDTTSNYSLTFKKSRDGVGDFVKKKFIYVGLMGYVRSDAQNHIKPIAYPTKKEMDGALAYTISSSGINRILRGVPHSNEITGEYGAALNGAILGADGMLSKHRIIDNSLTLFRGIGWLYMRSNACDAEGKLLPTLKDVKELEDTYSTNTAFTSTTVNVATTPMFALHDLNAKPRRGQTPPPKEIAKHGIILCLSNNYGLEAAWVHNQAGWEQQFEVLVHRKYDIHIKENFMDINLGEGIVHFFNAEFVEHKRNGKLPETAKALVSFAEQQGANPNKQRIDCYDSNGLVSMNYRIEYDSLSAAVEMLRNDGVRNINYFRLPEVLPAMHELNAFANTKASYMLLMHTDREVNAAEWNAWGDTRVKCQEGWVSDVAFMLNPNMTGGYNLDIYDICGEAKVLRNYWESGHSWERKTNVNYSWTNRDANKLNMEKHADKISSVSQFMGVDPEMINGKDVVENMKYKRRNTIPLQEATPEAIYAVITNYMAQNKDIVAYPLEGIAKSIDQIFSITLLSEGFTLWKSKRVERKGKENDPQDGYVPLSYLIDGEEDDTLNLILRISRDKKTGELVIDYKGKSKNGKVDSTKHLHFNSFTGVFAQKTIQTILYEFASKLNLSCTAKAERMVEKLAMTYEWKTDLNRVKRDIRTDGSMKSEVEVLPVNVSRMGKSIDLKMKVGKPNTSTYIVSASSVTGRTWGSEFNANMSVNDMLTDFINATDKSELVSASIYEPGVKHLSKVK